MSLFAELKRRNVIRIAIAYGVAAWFVLQLSDVVLDNINAPDWVMQAIMMALAIGLPVVALLAWAFEMTPEGIKKEKDVDRSQSMTSVTGRKLDRMIIGILTVTVGYLMVDKLVLQDSSPAPTETTQSAPIETVIAEDIGPSVAVLPFVNMSGDIENEYFSDGLTETLLHMLAQLPELRVAARTSSFAFKGKNISVDEIADALGVAHILEGSVQKSGERVRITAQLVRADDGFHVWSQNYTRPLEDIFAIQDEIATDVATALDASLLGNAIPDLKSMNTTDLKAYDNYLKGLEQQAIFSYGSLNIAEDHFKQALARDPDFTDARLALVRNYLLKQVTGAINEQEVRDLVAPLLAQVRESNPDDRLARAFELQIELWNSKRDYSFEEVTDMITELRNMLPLIADESLIRISVARSLDDLFKQERDAIEVLEAGLLLDPLSDRLHAAMGNIHEDHERFDEALASFQRAQQLAPQNPNHYGDLAELERQRNNLAGAMQWQRKAIEVDPQDHELAAYMANTFYGLRLPEEGDRWMNRVNALVPGSATARKLEVDRALAKDDFDRAIELSRSMVVDQVDLRRGGFLSALFTYTTLMMNANRSEEAYKVLVSIRPEITKYGEFPADAHGLFMQFASVQLMTGFESFETRQQSWSKIANNLDARGFPWRDPGGSLRVADLIIMGDVDAAVENLLNERLNKPLATNVDRHRGYSDLFFQPALDDPRVMVRLAELDAEYEQLRKQIGEMVLQPEWSQ